MGRVVNVLNGMDDVPGATITRYCASSVQTTRMAFHAIKAGEGDVFVSAGVETVSRFAKGTSDHWPDTQQPALRRRRGAHREDRRGRASTGTTRARTARFPTSTSRWARPPRTSPGCAASPARSSTSSASARRTSPRRRSPTASGPARSPRSPPPDGTVVSTDDGPRAGVTLEAVAELKPVFRPDGVVTAGNCCPLNDGAAAVVIMSDTKAAELGLTPLARIVSTGVTGLSPEIMGLGPVEATKQALAHAGMTHRRHRPGRDQRGVRRAGRAVVPGPRHRPRPAQRQRRRDRGRPPVRHDRRPAAEHDAQHASTGTTRRPA